MPPMDLTDQQLLQRYARERAEAAFTEVVRRYLDLVYSAALRLTAGDAALAEDVTQKVFADLAQKAARVAGCASLAGWLHTQARYVALTAIRGESRRRAREQESLAMNEPTSTEHLDWDQLRPLLDEAVGQLRSTDRDAVIMRFFENKSHGEVGAALGLRENAARMRIERALEKLRAYFLRRGITASVVVIAAAMSANSVQAAPAGLARKVGDASLTGAADAGGLGYSLGKFLFMTTKTKIVIATAVVAVLAALLITLPDWQKPASAPVAENLATTKAAPAAANTAKPEATPIKPIADVQRVVLPTTPPAPAPAATTVAANNPPISSLGPSQTKAIQNNLRILAAAGNSYMEDKGVTQATYYDLVGTGTDNYVHSITPVAGEDYQDFTTYLGQTQISITTPDGSEVIFTN